MCAIFICKPDRESRRVFIKLNILPTAYNAKVQFYTLENEIESFKHLLCLLALMFPIKFIITFVLSAIFRGVMASQNMGNFFLGHPVLAEYLMNLIQPSNHSCLPVERKKKGKRNKNFRKVEPS